MKRRTRAEVARDQFHTVDTALQNAVYAIDRLDLRAAMRAASTDELQAWRQNVAEAAVTLRSVARVLQGGTPTSCANCGHPFEHANPEARYCSNACRQAAYRQRRDAH